MRIISYNLREHSARGELAQLVAANADVDAMCLQECDDRDMPARIGPLSMVDQTKTNRLGLAMYLREDRYTVHASKLFSLRRSLHDVVMAPAHERLLAAHVTNLATGQQLVIGDFHAAPLTARNALRRKQIASAHQGMQTLAPGVPAVMVGDFNYPWFVAGLERRLEGTGFQLTRTPQPTYLKYKYFRGYFDFATSSGLSIEDIDVLPQGSSDHMPIRLTARITPAIA